MSADADTDQARIHVIELWPAFATCSVCEAEHPCKWALATYEDVLIADDSDEEWYGQPCCKRCYDAWRSGVIKAGMTLGEARAIVRVGDDVAREALDRGDT